MAHHKSALKRIRSNERKRIRNRMYISKVRTSIKKFKVALDTNTPKDVLVSLFRNAQSLVAKAAAKGILHKNNMRRKISKLNLLLKKATNDLPVHN